MELQSSDSPSAQEKKDFVMHEDLLCVNSPFFRKKLQPKRRAVEGDCFICHESITPGVKELTFCKTSCGGNFHSDCIEDWKKEATGGQVAKCPLCRNSWTDHFWLQRMSFPDVNEVAFEMYTEWLYKGYITDYQGLEGEAENEGFDFWSDLIGAYSLGLRVEDPVFYAMPSSKQ